MWCRTATENLERLHSAAPTAGRSGAVLQFEGCRQSRAALPHRFSRSKSRRPGIRQPFKARTPEELFALLGAVATAILAVIIIITTLYFGREIFIPIAIAILLSFVLAPLVGLLQRIRVAQGMAS